MRIRCGFLSLSHAVRTLFNHLIHFCFSRFVMRDSDHGLLVGSLGFWLVHCAQLGSVNQTNLTSEYVIQTNSSKISKQNNPFFLIFLWEMEIFFLQCIVHFSVNSVLFIYFFIYSIIYTVLYLYIHFYIF